MNMPTFNYFAKYHDKKRRDHEKALQKEREYEQKIIDELKKENYIGKRAAELFATIVQDDKADNIKDKYDIKINVDTGTKCQYALSLFNEELEHLGLYGYRINYTFKPCVISVTP